MVNPFLLLTEMNFLCNQNVFDFLLKRIRSSWREEDKPWFKCPPTLPPNTCQHFEPKREERHFSFLFRTPSLPLFWVWCKHGMDCTYHSMCCFLMPQFHNQRVESYPTRIDILFALTVTIALIHILSVNYLSIGTKSKTKKPSHV